MFKNILLIAFLCAASQFTPFAAKTSLGNMPIIITGKTVGIEAGHSSTDPGVPSCDNVYHEANITYDIAQRVQQKLLSIGYQVTLFRDNKAEIAGATFDAFIALHVDYCPEGIISGYKAGRYAGAAGTGLLGNNDSSDQLTQAIWDAFGAVTGIPQDYSEGHYTADFRYYFALAGGGGGVSAQTPSLILEMGWMRDPDLSKLINDPDNIATGVADGIVAFLDPLDPNGSFGANASINEYFEGTGNKLIADVCADNLPGHRVYLIAWRRGDSGGSERWFFLSANAGTSTCVNFPDIDGAGDVIQDRPYRVWVALDAPPDINWPTHCFTTTVGYGMCTAAQYPASDWDGTPLNIGLPGDVNCDSTRDAVDGMYILQYSTGLRQAAHSCLLAPDTLNVDLCDANADANCDAIDTMFTLQCTSGLHNPSCPAPAQPLAPYFQPLLPSTPSNGSNQP